ncbi:hypothetical protein C2845_PM10G02320 [Panicum miliaceum]|uniref:Uncharacterized protein n=1 Tax=Panicum miliaceum TaxID=4540 RepID=A0A3L6PFP1_PANMI|nr:hypothetical protein C2845_PM10G02320 [Panicum miliaceum]
MGAPPPSPSASHQLAQGAAPAKKPAAAPASSWEADNELLLPETALAPEAAAENGFVAHQGPARPTARSIEKSMKTICASRFLADVADNKMFRYELEKYSEDKFAQEFGTIVCSDLTSGAAPVLPSPQLKSHNSGTEKSCLPSVGIYNSINKMMETGILTETSKSEIEPSLNFLSGDEHRYFKVGSQDLSATFPDRCHHHVLSDPVALQRTIEESHATGGIYHELGDVLSKNRQKMFHSVLLPHDYKQFDPSNQKQPTFALFWDTFSRYIIHHLLVCICRDGHEQRNICWDGAFDIADILIAPGHIRINPKVREVKYHPAGGQADYNRLHDIIWAHFRDPSNGAVPMHALHLFHQLGNCPDNWRTDRAFITFLINHPSLLSCSDREKLYNQVDQKIRQLGKRYLKKLRALVGRSTCLGWQTAARSVAGLEPTYMYNARFDSATNTRMSLYTHQVDQCFHFCRNFLTHLKRGVTLEVAESSLVMLWEMLLSDVILKLIVSFNGPPGWDIAKIIENTNSDTSSMVLP